LSYRRKIVYLNLDLVKLY